MNDVFESYGLKLYYNEGVPMIIQYWKYSNRPTKSFVVRTPTTNQMNKEHILGPTHLAGIRLIKTIPQGEEMQ